MKRLYFKSIVSCVISFLSLSYKVVCLFPFRPCTVLFIYTHASFWILHKDQVILPVWCFCLLFKDLKEETIEWTRMRKRYWKMYDKNGLSLLERKCTDFHEAYTDGSSQHEKASAACFVPNDPNNAKPTLLRSYFQLFTKLN